KYNAMVPARNHITGAAHRAANGVIGAVVDLDAVKITQGCGPGCVNADVIAGDNIVVVRNLQALAAVTADDVACACCRAADGIPWSAEMNSVALIRQCGCARSIEADIVSGQ